MVWRTETNRRRINAECELRRRRGALVAGPSHIIGIEVASLSNFDTTTKTLRDVNLVKTNIGGNSQTNFQKQLEDVDVDGCTSRGKDGFYGFRVSGQELE
ncbi:unnamed protein product [Dovyalis caffra]|uniref:Uncharacterized protein n=1 Tax=Dovyalis caffra TaxID=77055 RepID=A0AAV1RWZ2_9ROSI|nr:unnamed protein product [Dovyalis caffra]